MSTGKTLLKIHPTPTRCLLPPACNNQRPHPRQMENHNLICYTVKHQHLHHMPTLM
ncbi:hypothetical protein BDA96_07G063100 [Sorghum bicolor]|uniref:Uncharacterized protein n=2 Tax=Sorghum bicolor TaxID=4558 RepID=A0A921U8Z4_SORBI|nr:hypothetical protein BDA96_07G063100 [Sorghum bicolor]KXG24570.1 hypothetical protein SORBI_3007G060300 [Sorghum bicolor]